VEIRCSVQPALEFEHVSSSLRRRCPTARLKKSHPHLSSGGMVSGLFFRRLPVVSDPAAMGSVFETSAPADSQCLSVFPSSVNPSFRCCPCVGPKWLREMPTVTARFQTHNRDVAVVRRVHRICFKSNRLCSRTKPRAKGSVRSAATVLCSHRAIPISRSHLRSAGVSSSRVRDGHGAQIN
jgi:hypothetical protein